MAARHEHGRSRFGPERKGFFTRQGIDSTAHRHVAYATGIHHFYGQSILGLLSGSTLAEMFKGLSILEAGIDTVGMLALIYMGAYFSSKIINRLEDVAKLVFSPEHSIEDDGEGNVLVTFLECCRVPLERLVPFYAFTLSLTLIAAFIESSLCKVEFSNRMYENASRAIANGLSQTSSHLLNATQVVVIVFFIWSLLNLKDNLVQAILNAKRPNDVNIEEVSRVLKPMSQLLTWGAMLAGMGAVLITLGVDVTPMLTLGSVSTIAVGFAAQSTVGNLVSALALYTSRAFIAGDRVQFKSMSGSTVVSGTVQDIRPMSTLVKCDNGSLVYVNNKDLATSFMVVNESEQSNAKLSSSIPVLEAVLTVQYKYVDLVADIVKDITEHMQAHPDLDHSLARVCYVKSFTPEGIQIALLATLSRRATSRKGQVITDLLLTSEAAVRKYGAYLYVKRGQELPPVALASANY